MYKSYFYTTLYLENIGVIIFLYFQLGRKGETREFSSDDDQSYPLLDYIPQFKV